MEDIGFGLELKYNYLPNTLFDFRGISFERPYRIGMEPKEKSIFKKWYFRQHYEAAKLGKDIY